MEKKTAKLGKLGLGIVLLLGLVISAGPTAAEPVRDATDTDNEAGSCVTVYTGTVPPQVAVDPEACEDLIPVGTNEA